MKNIHDKLSESLKKLSEIDKFLDTLAYLSKDNIVANTILPEITKRTLEMRNIGMDAIVNCNKLISKSKGTNRFDIMKSDGSIEIGLVSKDANTLIKMYEMSGEKIQILREINEFGFIVNEKEPNYNTSVTDYCWGEPITGTELYNVLHPSEKEKVEDEPETEDTKLDNLLTEWKDTLNCNKKDSKKKVKKSLKKTSKKPSKKSKK